MFHLVRQLTRYQLSVDVIDNHDHDYHPDYYHHDCHHDDGMQLQQQHSLKRIYIRYLHKMMIMENAFF